MTATQSIIEVTEQSACFGRGGVTSFTERRVTGDQAVDAPTLTGKVESATTSAKLPKYSPHRHKPPNCQELAVWSIHIM